MDLAEILKPEAVKVFGKVSSKKRLLHDVSDIVHDAYGLCSETAVTALQDRETLGPTGVGNGIAIPHARLSGLEEVIGAFVRLESPIDFEAVDRQPVDLIFALFAPEEAGVDHLKALALVARSLRDTNLCAKLRANTDPALLYTILTEKESTQAA